jgi:uncharacterized protein YbjT (DUF2867 family)
MSSEETMPAGKILVTGALGNVGAEVVQQLLIAGLPCRATDISVEKIHERFGSALEAVWFDFSRPETFAPAFEGVERMFLMRPPQISDVKRLMFPALDAAAAAGVKQVVFLSLIGIEKTPFVPHFKVEQYLRRSGMDWTFLRSSFFMQNLNTTHRREILGRSEIFIPAGRSKTSFLHVRDIAAVAVAALSQGGHTNQAYDLTGPETLDYWQAADILSETLGRKITYRNPGPLRFLLRTVREGTPLPFALVMTGLYTATRMGQADIVTGEVERLTGRPPISFRQYAEETRSAWL